MTRIEREGLERIPLYSPTPLAGVDLDLRDNVNMWGAPPRALAALQASTASRLTEYPSVTGGLLRDTLAAQLNVSVDAIVTGCGSDDVIDASFRAVAEPGAKVAYPDPTFSMVPVFARLNNLTPVGVPLLRDGSADIEGLLATDARVIYLCSPNNPTGTETAAEAIRDLIARAPGVVLLDQAYAEFSSAPDWIADAPGMEKVLITRTFSKAWGLAGLRVGYGIGGAALVNAVRKSEGPYKLNAAAELAASTALREDGEWMRAAAREAAENRDRLQSLLSGRVGVRPWISGGNFVFLEVADRADEIAGRFQAAGIGVRAFRGLAGIGEGIRIGMAPRAQMERVAAVAEGIWP